MRRPLEEIAPRFVDLAHSIVMSVVATAGPDGRPRTRVMQPLWTWDGTSLTGWLSTSTTDPKVDDLRHTPALSITYWNPAQDTCTADCDVELITDDAERAAAWDRFRDAPPPAGFDPAIHPDWDSAASPTFGVLRLTPTWLRVMPGSLLLRGEGEVWTWRRPGATG
jgi:general stress protein 26